MPGETDRTLRFSGRALARAAGVLPQTRESWIRRGLLQQKESYDLDDLAKVVALDLLQRCLPKGDARNAWSQLEPKLDSIAAADILVWESGREEMTIAEGADALVEAVSHGRPVRVLPIGKVLATGPLDRTSAGV